MIQTVVNTEIIDSTKNTYSSNEKYLMKKNKKLRDENINSKKISTL